MLDFFDEKHWWNKPDVRTDKPLEWCPIHSRYYDKSKGQDCILCESEG